MSMLKFLLQPMLEKAINHGLKNVRTGGKIGINVFSEELVFQYRKDPMICTDFTVWGN